MPRAKSGPLCSAFSSAMFPPSEAAFWTIGHAEEFLAGQRAVAETPQHPAGDQISSGLVHTAGGHAVMRCLDNHANALRLKHVVDGVGDLRRHLLLNLQALGINVDYPGQFGNADHAAIWDVGHPGPADDWRCGARNGFRSECPAARSFRHTLRSPRRSFPKSQPDPDRSPRKTPRTNASHEPAFRSGRLGPDLRRSIG